MSMALVIDSSEDRRTAMCQFIGSERCAGTKYTPQGSVVESVIFVHANDDRQRGWRQFVTGSCSGKWVVMYGGDGVTESLLRRDDPKIDLSQNAKWFAVERPVGDAPETTDWHPRDFVDAIEAGVTNPTKLFAILTGFDPVLEAKLNFLYECLDACHDPDHGKLASLEHNQNWVTVLDGFNEKPGDTDEHKRQREVARKSAASAWASLKDAMDREKRIEKLKGLRDALLGSD